MISQADLSVFNIIKYIYIQSDDEEETKREEQYSVSGKSNQVV